MKTKLTLIAASLALLAACDRVTEPANTPTIAKPTIATPSTATPHAATPTPGPAEMNQNNPMPPMTTVERKKSDEPVQGQVDTTQPAQRKDFEKK